MQPVGNSRRRVTLALANNIRRSLARSLTHLEVANKDVDKKNRPVVAVALPPDCSCSTGRLYYSITRTVCSETEPASASLTFYQFVPCATLASYLANSLEVDALGWRHLLGRFCLRLSVLASTPARVLKSDAKRKSETVN